MPPARARTRALLALAAAAALLLPAAASSGPQQLHISYGNAPDEMNIMWATDAPTRSSMVEYTLVSVAPQRAVHSFARGSAAAATLLPPDVGETRTAPAEQRQFAASTSRNMTLHQARSASTALFVAPSAL